MPTSLIMKLTGDKDKRHGPYMASMLQGVMMEKIDPVYAARLHESGIHPYSQYVQEKDGVILWHVQALSKEAEDEVISPLLDMDFSVINLTHRQELLRIEEKAIRRVSYEQLIEEYYLGECDRDLPIRIRTPMAFKQSGRYCIFPSARLVFQSLMMRFDACSPDSSIFTDELLQEFETLTEIIDYRLRSVRFSLEGVRIPSFIGDFKIHVNGPQQMANVAWMLAKFGEYSGVGINTGIGMGAVSIEEYRSRKQISADSSYSRQV